MTYIEFAIFASFIALGAAAIGFLLGRRGADDSELARDLAVQEAIAERVPGLEAELSVQKAKVEALQADKVEAAGARAKAEEAARAAKEAEEKSLQRLNNAQADIAALRERVEGLEKNKTALEENVALLKEMRQQMTQEFGELANKALANQGETLKSQNKDQLEALLNPMHTRLKEFREGLDRSHTDAMQQRTQLGEQLRGLTDLGQAMTSEASNLTRALKSDSQAQGAWGEMILETILERSGLEEGREFHTQESHTLDDGKRIRPDVIVDLPGGTDRIVIDSKVSLTAFDDYVNAPEEGEREAALARHVTSMRNHVKSLAAKDYAREVGTRVDYVIMFVPIEGALAAASASEAGLLAEAAGTRVMIATPTTLMALLRTVASLWRTEQQNQNARDIADRAGRLYDKFVNFVGDLETIGKSLDGAQKAYGDAFNKLKLGRGNLVRQSEQLKALGARSKKSLDQGLVDSAEEEHETQPVLEFSDSEQEKG
ncbi:MAG: DNA recombination protein RmuC [Alphaproteobacteria bacterium]